MPARELTLGHEAPHPRMGILKRGAQLLYYPAAHAKDADDVFPTLSRGQSILSASSPRLSAGGDGAARHDADEVGTIFG